MLTRRSCGASERPTLHTPGRNFMMLVGVRTLWIPLLQLRRNLGVTQTCEKIPSLAAHGHRRSAESIGLVVTMKNGTILTVVVYGRPALSLLSTP